MFPRSNPALRADDQSVSRMMAMADTGNHWVLDTLLRPMAAVINRGIDDNDRAQDLCDALDGRALRIVARPLPEPIVIAATDGLVEISCDAQRDVDVEIAGTLLELNRLMFIDSRAPIREGRVEITGDVEIADRFREMLLCARPDLEDTLAEWFGEPAAADWSSLVRGTLDRFAGLAEEITERAAGRLHKTTGPLPTRSAVETHFRAVDELVDDVERIAARIDRLTGPAAQ